MEKYSESYLSKINESKNSYFSGLKQDNDNNNLITNKLNNDSIIFQNDSIKMNFENFEEKTYLFLLW